VIYIAIYVDDLLIVATTREGMTWISSQLRKRWETTHHVGNDLNYVGLHIVRDRAKREIRVDMSGNILKIIEQFGAGVKECNAPAVPALLQQSGPPLSVSDKGTYMSLVMSVLYPARLCHLAILFPTVILATRLVNPTASDLTHAYRIVGYLKTQIYHCFIIRGPAGLAVLKLYVDAAHGLHHDAKGHGCIIAFLGDSALAWRSFKLGHVCLSSTESEISACSDAVTYVIWMRELLTELGHSQLGPTPIGQDNMSAVIIMENGGQFKRTKHMHVRFHLLLENVRNRVISFFRCPTDQHVADIGTKVHPAPKLLSLLSLLPWGAPPHQEGV
jgi:hypothetical protein